MSESEHAVDDFMTLEPPGSIAVVGAGPLGVEAALYGRYLGYDVTLIESVAVGASLRSRMDDALPMLPARCLSPIAHAALRAQRSREDSTKDQLLPTTIGQWVEDALVPLVESDLLSGRFRVGRVKRIAPIDVPIEPEEGDEIDDEIPPDFRITIESDSDHPDELDVEAVVLAVGSAKEIELGFEPTAPYFFRIGATPTGDAERDLQSGLREIVAVFAALGGRSDLDLYRPRRL